MKQHPLSALFPAMPDEEFEELKASVQKDGLFSTMTTLDGMVLDGWHRYKACLATGTEPKFQELRPNRDPLEFVLAANMKRRHLTASQRSVLAAQVANMAHGGNRQKQDANLRLESDNSVQINDAAKRLNVSPRSVDTAKRVLAKANPETIAKVKSGKMSVSAAAKEIDKPKPATKTEKPKDQFGHEIPASCLDRWNHMTTWREEVEILRRIQRRMARDLETYGTIAGGDFNQAFVTGFKTPINSVVKHFIPYTVCLCRGNARVNCTKCLGVGYLTKDQYEIRITDEARKMWESSDE